MPGVRQQQLADALCMDAGNIVLLLNELEDLGYISRIRDRARVQAAPATLRTEDSR